MMRVIHTSRSPFELWLLAALVIVGAGGLLVPDQSSRVVTDMAAWSQIVWYGGLLTAGGLGLAGALSRRLWSLYLERGALIMLAVLLAVYAAMIVASERISLAPGVLLTVGLVVACAHRVRQINGDIRHALDGEAGDDGR